MPELRSGTSTSTLKYFSLLGGSAETPRPPPIHLTPTSEEDALQDDAGEQVDALPRRTRRPQAPDLEDALTRLTQTVGRMAAIQQRPPPADSLPTTLEEPLGSAVDEALDTKDLCVGPSSSISINNIIQ